MFLAFVSTALAGVLGLTTTSSTVLRVDGETVPFVDGDVAWLELSGDRLHVIEARTSSDRPLGTIEVKTPDGMEVQVEWRGKSFAVTNIRAARADAPVARTTAPPAAPNGPGTVVLNIGVPGMSTTMSVTDPTGYPPPPPPATRTVVSTAPVVVELLPMDSEWCNVWIDGERVAEFRNSTGKKSVTLTPGPHKVEVKDFMENETWLSGTLTVTGPGPMKLGFKQGVAEVYNAPGAWRAGR